MIQSLEIDGLRGIREGGLETLAPLTVLVGPNSSGKSSVLDALLIGANPSMPQGLLLASRRRPGLRNGITWLFWRGSEASSPALKVQMASGASVVRSFGAEARLKPGFVSLRGTQTVSGPVYNSSANNAHIDFDESGSIRSVTNLPDVSTKVLPGIRLVDFAADSTSPLHELYTEVVRQGRRMAALSIIKDIVPGLVGLEILTEDNEPIIYLVFDDYAVPAAVAGEGVQALIRASLELAASPGGTVLLEEPEVHQHPRAIWQTARAIWAAVNRDVQVILSTHSLELIDALLSVVPDAADLEKMAVFRLLLEDGQLKSSRLTGTQAAEARSTIEEDLR